MSARHEPWLLVLGLGEEGFQGLSEALKARIAAAELVVGGARHLALLAESGIGASAAQRRVTWASPLSATIDDILLHRGRPVVVLATGDPMHFGIGVTLARHVAAEEMTVRPHLSAFTLAAARLAWPLDETACLTLHGRSFDLINAALAPGRRLLVLSHDGKTAALIARRLVALGYGESVLHVFEHMGGAKEKRLSAKAVAWHDASCADLNTIAIECHAGAGAEPLSCVPGLPDAAFQHDGQLTKREVRAATLALLAPLPGELLWDVGAGAGSIAIEWMRADRSMSAIAIEANAARQDLILRNAAALGVPHLQLVAGAAPAAFAGLAPPDAIFIGGGLDMPDLLTKAWAALKPGGRLVANAVTMEGEAALFTAQERWQGSMTRIAVQRLEPVGGFRGWKPLMPVLQWRGQKA